MTDARARQVSLVGHVIEDVTFNPLDAARYTVELLGARREPFYKAGGFFAFTDVYPGEYTLRITGERFQTQQHTVRLPFAPLVFEQPGDDELVVVVKTAIAGNGSNPSPRITFDPVALRQPIRAGSTVLAQNLTTKLAASLDPGRVASARLNSIAGLAEGSIVRIVRDKSIRLRLDPYSPDLSGLTAVVGRVVSKKTPERALAGARVRVLKVNDVNVVLTNVAGVRIATAQLGQTKVVLGAERELATLSNQKGDFNLYFTREGLQSVTLRATLAGYVGSSKRVAIVEGARHRADFQLQTETT